MRFLVTEIDKQTGNTRTIGAKRTWESATALVSERRRGWCEKMARGYAHKIEFMSEAEK